MEKQIIIRNLVLSLTGTCNYACKYCYASGHPKESMPVETALKAVDMAGKIGQPFILQFTGGEPLLAFSVIQAVIERVETKQYNAVLQLQTNASLITEDIADYLKAHKVAIGVSLDGRPRVNDSLRIMKNGNSASRATIRGIRILASRNIPIGLTCVVTADNVKTLPGIVQMAYFLGNVRQIGFDLLRCQGRGGSLSPASSEDVAAAIAQCFELAQKLEKQTGVHIRFSQLEKIRKIVSGKACVFGQCYAMRGEEGYVTSKGEIYACSSLVDNPEFLIGDVRQGIDTEKALQAGAIIAKAMRVCNRCPQLATCGGGCFTRWWGRDGKADEECAMQQTFSKYV